MDIMLWIVQAVIFIKLLSVAFTHGIQHSKNEMKQSIQKMGNAAKPMLIGSAILLFLGCNGLVLPGILSTHIWLTPIMAAILALLCSSQLFSTSAAGKNRKSLRASSCSLYARLWQSDGGF